MPPHGMRPAFSHPESAARQVAPARIPETDSCSCDSPRPSGANHPQQPSFPRTGHERRAPGLQQSIARAVPI